MRGADRVDSARASTTSAAALTVVSGAVLPDRPALGPVDVLIEDGQIACIGEANSLDAPARLDVAGAWLFPGFVDAHVHPIHAETRTSVGDVAPASGITTVLNHFYPNSRESLFEAAQRATREAAQGAADYGFHVRVTPDRLVAPSPMRIADGMGLIEQLRRLSTSQGVVSVKAFLAHADPSVVMSGAGLTYVLRAAERAGLPVIVHAEPGDVLQALDTLRGSSNSLLEHDQRRAPDLEAASVALASATARAVGARLYVAHLSSDLAVDALKRARDLGARVRGESCAHYMTLDSGADLGALGRVTPPLRPRASVAAMRRLAADPESAIDVLASDHCGYSADEKPLDDFAHAGNGLPGLDSLVPLLLDAVLGDGWLTPADIVRLAARGPADTFGIAAKGRIEVGADADLVVVDPAGTTGLRAEPPGPATAASPYGQRQLRGAVIHVLRRGVPLLRDAQPTEAGSQAGGRPVYRTEPTW